MLDRVQRKTTGDLTTRRGAGDPPARRAAREEDHDLEEGVASRCQTSNLSCRSRQKKNTHGLTTHRRQPRAVFKYWPPGACVTMRQAADVAALLACQTLLRQHPSRPAHRDPCSHTHPVVHSRFRHAVRGNRRMSSWIFSRSTWILTSLIFALATPWYADMQSDPSSELTKCRRWDTGCPQGYAQELFSSHSHHGFCRAAQHDVDFSLSLSRKAVKKKIPRSGSMARPSSRDRFWLMFIDRLSRDFYVFFTCIFNANCLCPQDALLDRFLASTGQKNEDALSAWRGLDVLRWLQRWTLAMCISGDDCRRCGANRSPRVVAATLQFLVSPMTFPMYDASG